MNVSPGATNMHAALTALRYAVDQGSTGLDILLKTEQASSLSSGTENRPPSPRIEGLGENIDILA